MTRKPLSVATAAIALIAGVSLAACQGEREAEVDTGQAEAEVTTNLPESQVSDEQLKAAAEGAAAIAETPQGSNTSVVVTPPSDQSGAGAAGTSAGATGTGTTTTPPKSSY